MTSDVCNHALDRFLGNEPEDDGRVRPVKIALDLVDTALTSVEVMLFFSLISKQNERCSLRTIAINLTHLEIGTS